jgi:phosphatidylserine/phosphatidylglycerophosphate/cardiolipin synthase-like enzyme
MTAGSPRRPARRMRWLAIGCGVVAGGALAFAGGSTRGTEKTVPAEVRVAFGSECEPLVIEALGRAKKRIDVAIFTFARWALAEALLERRQAGVELRIKIDAEQAAFAYTAELLARLRAAGASIELIAMPEGKRMHHKFAVIDGREVVTGSFNWTRQASEENWENLVVIRSKAIAARFEAEWTAIGSREAAVERQR